MRKQMLWSGFLMTVLALLVLAGRHAAADAPNVNAKPSPDLHFNGDIYDQRESDLPLDKVSEWRAKIAVGPNSNATVSIDLITDGGSGNQTDDGVTSGTVSGQGTKIAVEVFALGVTTTLVGVKIEFDFDASVLKFDKAENSAFLVVFPDPTAAHFADTAPVTLPESGFIGRAEFATVGDVTNKEFTLGIQSVTLAESNTSQDVITTTDAIAFNANVAFSSDFDGDGTVGIPDFLLFVNHFGTSRGGAGYDAKYDLDGNGVIGIPDFLIFVNNFGSQVPPSGGGATVTIPDANLRAVIADSLDKASGETITRAEMATLTRLDAPNKSIRDLTGLEHATNLQWLELGSVRVNNEWVNSNDISNLSPLSNLTNLTGLNLWNNSISDISVLSNLTNLRGLDLGGNSISDISALSNLTNLTGLYLWGNSISSISALSNLTNLTYLDLYVNSISDISALSNLTNLGWLNLWENSISDISALSNLTNLGWLNLGGNSISDILPLVANAGLGSGDTVELRRNPLSNTSINTHIPTLQRRGVTVEFDSSQVPPSGGGATVTIADANLRAVITDRLGKARNASITRAEMATLTRIDAYNKGIRNLTGLEHATNLQRLGLGRVRVNNELVNSNDISNLSPLSNLTNLTYLSLTSNSISDISALSNLTNLTGLHLGDNSISDISALSNLTNLERLNLWDNSISDISSLSNLTNLTNLGLGGNSIADISALSNLTNLERLNLWDNSISDISSLSNLTNLTNLGLGGNSIADISALSNLTNLTRINLWDNSISDISSLSNLINLTELYLYNNSISSISSLSNLTNLTVAES